jgi:hypothetical protein
MLLVPRVRALVSQLRWEKDAERRKIGLAVPEIELISRLFYAIFRTAATLVSNADTGQLLEWDGPDARIHLPWCKNGRTMTGLRASGGLHDQSGQCRYPKTIYWAGSTISDGHLP